MKKWTIVPLIFVAGLVVVLIYWNNIQAEPNNTESTPSAADTNTQKNNTNDVKLNGSKTNKNADHLLTEKNKQPKIVLHDKKEVEKTYDKTSKKEITTQNNKETNAPTDENSQKKVEKKSFIPVKPGNKGPRVKEIQKLLNKFSYGIPEDGSYGPATKEVVHFFQKATDLKQTGTINKETYHKLTTMKSTNLAAEYLALVEERKKNEEQKRKEAEEKRKAEEEKRKKEAELAKANRVYIPVKTLMQTPELPNGCEITSLTAVLNYNGHSVSKLVMADTYLSKEPLTYKGDKRYGPNPYKHYVGDPRQQPGGWYSFAPPIVQAGNDYLASVGSSNKVVNVSGSSKADILNYLDQGYPVVIWTTLDMSAPKQTSHWYLNDTGEYYKAYVNLHVTVLNGYEGNKVHVMNPLKGQVTYNIDTFFNSYNAMGKHAIIVK